MNDRYGDIEKLAFFRAALDCSVDQVFLIDPVEMKFVDVNDTACRDLQYSREELLAMGPQDIKPLYSRDQLAAEFQKLFDHKGKSGIIETVHQCKDGSEISVEVILSVLEREERKIIVAMARDVRQRKNAEREILDKKTQMDNILEGMLNALAIFDPIFDEHGAFVSYRFVYINKAYEHITGVKKEEVKGKSVHEVWPGTEPEWVQRYSEVSLTGVSRSFALYHGPTDKIYHCNVFRPDQKSCRFCVVFDDVTKRKKDEQELRSMNAFLDAVVEMSPFALWISDAEGEVGRVNQALCRTLNLDPGQIIGKYNIFEDQNLQEQGVMPAVNAVFESHESARFRMRWLPSKAGQVDFSGGRVRDIDVSLFPILDEVGQLKNVVCQFADITELKVFQQKLEESRERLQLALVASQQGHWDWDLMKNSAVFSNEVLDMLGYVRSDIEDSPIDFWKSLIHPQDRKGVFEELEDCFRADNPYFSYEYRLRCKDGRYKWVLAAGKLVEKGEDGHPRRMVGVFQDIDERKAVEEKLQEASRIIGMTSSVIFRWEPSGRWPVSFVTENVVFLLGFSSQEFLEHKMCYVDVIYPDDLEKVTTEYQACVQDPGCREFIHEPYRVITREGDIKWVEDRVVIDRDADGEIAGLLGVVVDITERVEAEQKLRQMQKQLFQSEKMAAVGHLSAGVAHEVKNPLAIIQLGMDSLSRHIPEMDEKHGRYVEMIRSATNRANRVIMDLMNFSRYSDMEFKDISVADVVRSTVGLIENMARIRDVSLTCDIECPKETLIPGDEQLLEQALLNLLHNAIDATSSKKGSVVIKLFCLEKKESAGRAVIEIADAGDGIPEHLQDKIFNPFFTTKEQGEGTGLGLSIVHTIIEGHKGDIQVASREGGGTTFTITLPLCGQK